MRALTAKQSRPATRLNDGVIPGIEEIAVVVRRRAVGVDTVSDVGASRRSILHDDSGIAWKTYRDIIEPARLEVCEEGEIRIISAEVLDQNGSLISRRHELRKYKLGANIKRPLVLSKRPHETVDAAAIPNFLNNACGIEQSPIERKRHRLRHVGDEFLNLISEADATHRIDAP